MTTATTTPMDRWETLPWRTIQRNVFKVQKRIYQASQRDDVKTVREFQRLLMNSRSAKLLTVRKVTQDNRGKGTAGVDGVKALTPPQRLKLAHTLSIGHKARAVRRVLDHCELFPTERGTMQGGTISPLLANVALHGMEELLAQRFPAKSRKCFYAPRVIRYADDLVVLHKDHAVIEQCQEMLAEWLQNMGLELKPSTSTLKAQVARRIPNIRRGLRKRFGLAKSIERRNRSRES